MQDKITQDKEHAKNLKGTPNMAHSLKRLLILNYDLRGLLLKTKGWPRNGNVFTLEENNE